MVFFTYFPSKYYFLSLLNWIRTETHFPLVSPFINFLLSHYLLHLLRCLHCKQQKIMKCHPQIVRHLIYRHRDQKYVYQKQKCAKCGTLGNPAKEDVCPLVTTLCFLFFKKKSIVSLKCYQICHSVLVWR